MTVIIYGDFNCPYSYLASQRAGRLREAGVAVDWRAVEHDRRLPAGDPRRCWRLPESPQTCLLNWVQLR
jgi:hypothetical protein